MEIISTVLPIFAIILLGLLAREKGFMPVEFLGPANRLVYYIAIPAMIFSSVSKASLSSQYLGAVLFITLASALCVYFCAWIGCRLSRMPDERCGVFIQSAGHGNLGYIGLPLAFYYLGEPGLVRAGILAGFLMILQNILSIMALQAFAPDHYTGSRLEAMVRKLITNPVIVSALAGIAVSALGLRIPKIAKGVIDILSGMAPPMALLLIGGSLSFKVLRQNISQVMSAVTFKLLILPAVGFFFYHWFHAGMDDYLPGLILLCSPTATISYVMAKEMHGDAEFAVATVSASTLFSMATFIGWLMAASMLSAP